MNQERIGKLIKDIRTKNNLSQQKFADKYGVTYQAVSKWETGKNIPDISILKQICDDYDLDINIFLRESKIDKKKNKFKNKYIYLLIVGIILVISIFLLYFHFNREEDFEFKTLSSSCSNFNLSGSIAYNKSKSSIYISHIDYCGGEDDTVYRKIDCALYEKNGKVSTEITKCNYKRNSSITLEEFLRDVTFNVDNYDKTCDVYSENSLYLEIVAVDRNNETTTYKVPLVLEDNCIK